MRIEVTNEDIRQGEAGYCDLCPIALALKRAFPDVKPYVWYEGFDLTDSEGNCAGASLPIEAQDFINHFDRQHYHRYTPFSFEVTELHGSNRLILRLNNQSVIHCSEYLPYGK